jgi:hypothetical protein
VRPSPAAPPREAIAISSVSATSSATPTGSATTINRHPVQAFDDVEIKRSASAAHILVKDRGLALQLLEQINAGEISFGDAARRHSTCSSSGKGNPAQPGPAQPSPAQP